MKITKIKGKDYVEVSERVKEFNAKYTNGKIISEVSYDGKYVRVKSTVFPDVGVPERFFTGHAEEDREQGNINKTNATENAETSAVGRALGLMGIGIIEGIASADEVTHAIHKQETPPEPEYVDSLPPLDTDEAFDRQGEPNGTLKEGSKCPNCPVGKMKLRNGKNGPFLACNAYPDCKTTASV